ncbi:PspC domain-containing protein [Saccharopolyspora sp. CA-218241]|uniref:PspC domain-containing protein n=1 Tax=Saccharopolyspora sp. CA-218241 TaxID=3240027 RepID=UPI003D976B2D
MTENSSTTTRKLRRSRDDQMLGGVCAGFAAMLGIDAAIVRVVLVAATLLGMGAGILIYLACWLIVPQESAQE